MGFTKAHGLAIAANGYIQNVVIERLSADPTVTEAGRTWFNTTEKLWKMSTLNGVGAVIVRTFNTKEEFDAFVSSLAATTAGASGASLIGYDGSVGGNGNVSTASGTLADALDSLTTAADNNAQSVLDLQSGSVANVQAETDSIEAAMGTMVDANGNYVQTSGTTYMDSAGNVTAAITALDTGITQEVSDRTTAVSNEASARSTADTALQTELDNTQTAAGLSSGGAYVADAAANYIDIATSLSNADSLLDNQIKSNADAITVETSRATAAEATLLPFAGGTMSGDIDMGGNKLTNVGYPGDANDGASKAYVDTVAQGLDPKESVRMTTVAVLPACTYANGASGVGATLTGDAVGQLADIDGITPVVGDRVLVKSQAASLQNGIYEVTTLGDVGTAFVLTRTVDFDGSPANEVTPGCYTFVEEGTSQANNGFAVTTNGVITIGTTGITFGQFSGAGQVIAGVGLSKVGNTVNANLGAGIVELPSDEIGIEVRPNSGLFTTVDGSTSSTNTDAQLAIQIDGTTLTTSAAGIKVADSVTSTITGLQTEIDNTQTGAGLGTNGAYTANGTKTHIATSVSLVDATEDLSDALDTEIADRGSADTSLQNNITAEETARTNADTALQTELDNTQTGAGLNADGTYAANVGANYIDTASSLKDATNKLDTALKTEETARTADDAALQTAIDAVETGAGLGTDGSYTANTSTNYMKTSTSLVDATEDLDTQVKVNADALATETTARTTADSALDTEITSIELSTGLNTDGTYNPHTGTNYINAASSVKSADGLLDTAIGGVQDELDATQSGAGLNADGSYAVDVSANYINGASTTHGATQALDSALKTEETSRTSADVAQQTEIDAIETSWGAYIGTGGAWVSPTTTNYINGTADLTAALNALDAQVKTNATSSTSGVSALQTELDATQTGAGLNTDGSYPAISSPNMFTGESSLRDAIVKLDSATASADTTLQGNIDAEETARVAADSSEASARSSADAGLQSEIDAVEGALGSYVNTSGTWVTPTGTTYMNSSTDMSDALVDLDAGLAQEVSDRATAVSNEATARTSADTTLQTEIDAIETSMGTMVDANGDYVAFTASNYMNSATDVTGAVTALDTALDAMGTAYAAADAAIQTEIDAIETSMGSMVSSSGAYVSFSGSNYIDGATDATGVLTILDSQAKTNADAIAQTKTDLNAQIYTSSSAANTTHSFTHNLNSDMVSVEVWVQDDDLKYRNDLVGITIDSANALTVDLTESKAIRVIIRKAEALV